MKCPLYKENLYIHFVNPIPDEEVVPVCSGTKEQERCKCGGDLRKCDFPGIRENGGKWRLVNDIMAAYETLGDLIKEMLEQEEKK